MSYVLLGFVAGLAGEEVPLVLLEGLVCFWQDTKQEDDPYIMVILRGHFKGKTGVRWHYLPIADRTASGMPYRSWIGWLVYQRVWIQRKTTGMLYSAAVREGRNNLGEIFPQKVDAEGRRLSGGRQCLRSCGQHNEPMAQEGEGPRD